MIHPRSLFVGLALACHSLGWVPLLWAFRAPLYRGPRGRIAGATAARRSALLASSGGSDREAEPPAPESTVEGQGSETAENPPLVPPGQPQVPDTRSRAPATRPGPTPMDLMAAMGTSPRRIFTSFVSATGIALGGNFLGVTSRLLAGIPEERVEATGIDTYFPRGEYKRCRTPEYTFVIPKEWVADTYVELAKAQRRVQPLDYSMQRSGGPGKITTLPDSAYGPPGRFNQQGVSQAGDTNVSVIVSSGFSGFTLRGSLGTPADAAETLLSRSIAPEGSGRTATLLRSVGDEGDRTYAFEYLLDRGTRGPPLRNIAVVAASPEGDKLYTLTVVAPAERWKDDGYDAKLRKIADSFHLR